MDLVIDTVGNSDNHHSFYKVMKTRGRLVRVNTNKYLPFAGKPQGFLGWFNSPPLPGEQDTSYCGRVINDKAINHDIFQSFNDDKELFMEDLAYLYDLLQIGKIKPKKIFSQVGFGRLEGEWKKVTVMDGGTNGVVVVLP